MFSQRAMDDAMKKANDIQNNTPGNSTINDPYAGKTYAPVEGGPDEFKRIVDGQFKPKRY